MQKACCDASNSVAGLDPFAPKDLTLLSEGCSEWIAALLNLVEEGAPWPEDLLKGKAAFLSKDAERTDDPLAYRVLLILPAIYRRWASARLHELKQWIAEWQLDGMYAGIEGFGADDAWWSTAMHLEHNRAKNVGFRQPPRTYLSASIK